MDWRNWHWQARLAKRLGGGIRWLTMFQQFDKQWAG
jgi:hypothetical protein